MAIKHLILSELTRGPAHGYELNRRPLQPLHTDFGVTKPHIYAALRSLEEDRLVRHRSARSGRFPEKRRYWITAAGRRHLKEWLKAPTDESPSATLAMAAWDPFAAKVYALGAAEPSARRRKALQQLAQTEERIKAYGKALVSAMGGRDSRLRWVLSHGLGLERARLAWLRSLAGRRRRPLRRGRVTTRLVNRESSGWSR
ncbi:MAG: PadR family transcriptional regulator [Nitrospirae bacterium]|nr:PadR family transcriptional regulator [Nitrospirota bacterium]